MPTRRALISFLAFLAGMVGLAMAKISGWVGRMDRFSIILRHTEIIASLADLAEIDRRAAKRLSEMARQRAIDRIDYLKRSLPQNPLAGSIQPQLHRARSP